MYFLRTVLYVWNENLNSEEIKSTHL